MLWVLGQTIASKSDKQFLSRKQSSSLSHSSRQKSVETETIIRFWYAVFKQKMVLESDTVPKKKKISDSDTQFVYRKQSLIMWLRNRPKYAVSIHKTFSESETQFLDRKLLESETQFLDKTGLGVWDRKIFQVENNLRFWDKVSMRLCF